MDKIEQLTQLFLRLDSGETVEDIRHEARDFLKTISPKDVALAEQSIMQAGADMNKLRNRCHQHVTLLGDQAARLRSILPINHLIRIILLEHEMVLSFLADLEELNVDIQNLSYCSATSFEIRKLNHIVGHIINADDHTHREDEVVFPELERRGFYGPPEILKVEHLGLDACKREISELAQAAGKKIDFSKFKLRLDAAVKYLVPALRQQIFTEDNILYPIALEVIEDRKVWDRIKAMCEQIGYCGFDARV